MQAPKSDSSEKAFQAKVVELAGLCGWLVYHTLNSIGSEAGFPDLVLVPPGWIKSPVLFRELKTKRGRVTPAQQEWINRLYDAGADVDVWRPGDWPQIERILNQKRRALRSHR